MTATKASSPSSTASSGGRGRAVLWWGLVIAALVVGVLLLADSDGNDSDKDPLGPNNPEPSGARAVARVLDGHGVDVDIVRNRAAFEGKHLDGDTTVLVSPASALSKSTADALRKHSRSAGTLVVLGMNSGSPSLLGVNVDDAALATTDSPTASCDLEPLSGLRLTPSARLGDRGFRGSDGEGCFAGGDDGDRYDRLWHTDSGSGPDVWLLGDDGVVTNADIEDGDDAAVVLRLLGQHSRLVWYVPDPADVPPGDTGSIRSQLPAWLFPALFLVTVALLGLMFARGRRLGRLVFEPLPVKVKAIESTLGRGRLYRRSGDRDHAAAVLRRSTRARLRVALKQPGDTPLPTLVGVVAARTGRDPDGVAAILVDAPVGNDHELAELARNLAAVEREVRHT